MKKASLTLLAILALAVNILPAQNVEADQAYIKAVTTKDIEAKVRLLKQYVSTYSGQNTRYENFVYANLCVAQTTSVSPDERISFGEKAIALDGLDDLLTFQVHVTVSSLYSQKGQNLDKAKTYALKAIQVAKAAKNKEEEKDNTAQWNKLIGAGNYAHGQALEKGNNPKEAVKAYLSSYQILKNPQIAVLITKLGKDLYDSHQFRDAEVAFKLATEVNKDFGSTAYYARCLYRNNKKTEALTYFKQAYNMQKNGDIAYNIGILLAGQARANPGVANEAIQFLLDAAFLSKANTKKAMDLAQGLFFNTAHKDLQYNEKVQELSTRSKKLADLTNSFNTKFGDKTEEELTDAEKNEMKTLLAGIDAEKKACARLEAETKAALEKFTLAIESAKKRLGING